jgi:protein-disulfide isomerase
MNKRFVIILAAIAVLFVGLVLFNKRGEKKADSDNQQSSSAQMSNHTSGQGTTGVTLTEWGDFQCPACGQFYPAVAAVREKYGDQITFRFRNFPLTQIHPNALISARAAEAAGLQGKFFEMFDQLYQGQKSWSESQNPNQFFEQYAEQLGLDMSKFREDMKSQATNDTVQADLAEAKRLNYQSTPTFEINNKKVENPGTIEEFYKLIDDAIAAKKSETGTQSPTENSQ